MSARSLVPRGKSRPLARRTIILSGDFGQARSHENLKRWIDNNGGTVTSTLSDKVTHVICSKHNWAKQPPIVQSARKNKNIKIVNLDWLETSLNEQRRPREGPFLWTNVDKEAKKAKLDKRVKTEKALLKAATDFQRGCKLAEEDLLSTNYHLYRDSTGFQYETPLWTSKEEFNFIYCHFVRLYESNHGPPYFYATATQYKLPGAKPTINILRPVGSSYKAAFSSFRLAFKYHTGVEWDYRLHGCQTRPEYHKADEKVDLYDIRAQAAAVQGAQKLNPLEKVSNEENEQSKPRKDRKRQMFKYLLPKPGEPLGEMGLEEEGIRKYGEPPEGLKIIGGTPPPRDESSEDENE